MTSMRIVRIHNELLGTYGDRGNADVLAFRSKFHGVKSEIIEALELSVTDAARALGVTRPALSALLR